jgi:hypothetical protein
MPVSFTLDHEHRVVIAVLTGEVTLAEIIQSMRAIEAAPGYLPTYSRFSDCRTITRLPTYDEARTIAEAVRRSVDLERPVRRAYLMVKGAPYGVGRIVETLASVDADLIDVFTDERLAREWVGLPPAEARPHSA